MTDKRSIRTKREIQRALNSLIQQVPFSKITVNMIAKEAMIHRNTLYLYYADKYALLTEIFESSITINTSWRQNLLDHPFLLFNEIYKQSFHNTIVIQQNDSEFDEVIAKCFTDLFASVIGDDYNQYFLLGRISAIITWINRTGQPYSIYKDGDKLDHIYTTQQFPEANK